MRDHGYDALRRQVLALYREGWRTVANIASLVHAKAETVSKILRENVNPIKRTVMEEQKKSEKKRVRPTVGQVRKLEATVQKLNEAVSEYQQTIEDLKRKVVAGESLAAKFKVQRDQLTDSERRYKVIGEELEKTRDELNALQKEYRQLAEEKTALNSRVKRSEAKASWAFNAWKEVCQLNDGYKLRLDTLEKRGFWARLFNKGF